MLKVRNRLLIAIVLLAVALTATVHGRAEASSWRTVSSSGFVKPVVRPNSGEPDNGDTTRNGLHNDGSGGIIVRLPNGYLLYLAISRVPVVGLGW